MIASLKAVKTEFIYAPMLILALGILILMAGCGDEKVIVRYRDIPAPIDLSYPPADTFLTISNPTFSWHPGESAVLYQLQVSSSPTFISKSIDVTTQDSSYTTISNLINGSYFWRVRGQNIDGVRGDWSDADIRTFFKSDYVNYIGLVSTTRTIGIPQDLFIRGDTAYIADGQADLTIIDISDKAAPFILKNIDTIDDDFAKSVYIAPTDTFPYAFVADMDGKVQMINTADTTMLFNSSIGTQNLEEVTGYYIQDTLYIFTVRSRSGFNLAGMTIYQIVYDPLPRSGDFYIVNPIDTPADANGVDIQGNYAFIACSISGLAIVDISDIYNPFGLTFFELDGSSLAVDVEGDYAYIAADRAGFYAINVSDPSNPVISAQVNTSGRSKDIHVAGNFAFIADGSSGLKVIDISVPDSAHFVAAYTTPYAYGVWADENYIYLCDRDEGLMIFENRTSR